jgi:hypothetical protein
VTHEISQLSLLSVPAQAPLTSTLCDGVVYYWCTRGHQDGLDPLATPSFTCKFALSLSGRCWIRTSDLLLVS